MFIKKKTVDNYVSEMRALIKKYKILLQTKDKASFVDIFYKKCPICHSDCKPCPWAVITGDSCFGDPNSHFYHIDDAAEMWASEDSFGGIPKRIYNHIEKRIEELEKWIPLYPEKVKLLNLGAKKREKL